MILIPFSLLLTLPLPPVVDAAAPTSIVCVSTPFHQPTIDGRLDEPLWQARSPVTKFLQDEPNEGAPVSERTEVVVAIDNGALYVGARLFDSSPDLIKAQLARRDDDISSDQFLLYLDPHRDRLSGFYFGVNAAGTQYDGTLTNDDGRDSSWDAVWESAVVRDKLGWKVEMRIPLSQLRFDGAAKRAWGINVERWIDRKKESALLAYTPRAASGFVSRFPELLGVESLAPPQRVELVPYVSTSFKHVARDPADPLAHKRAPLRAGLDLKAGVGGHLTLDGTIFPDFGQVEVDPAVINLSDVETFYPEKRAFFVEGADIFAFGSGGLKEAWNFDWASPTAFYSRRIGRAPVGAVPDEADHADVPEAVDIVGAGKLTGKVGDTSIGLLGAVTTAESAPVDIDGMQSVVPVDTRTYHSVARARRTFRGGRHALGAMATFLNRDLSEPQLADSIVKGATLAGLDGWATLDANRVWVLAAWAAYSRVWGTPASILSLQRNSVHYLQRPLASHLGEDPTRTSLAGYASRFALNKQSGNVVANAAVGVISPGFESNDLGFLSAADRINAHVASGYDWKTPGRVLREASVRASIFSNWDFGGVNTTRGFWSQQEVEFLNYWSASLTQIIFAEATDTRRTRGGPPILKPAGAGAEARLESDYGRTVYGGFHLMAERFEKGAARTWRVGGYLGSRFAGRVGLNFEPSFLRMRTNIQYLDTVDDPSATATFGRRYLFGDLDQRTFSASLRASYILTTRLSFQLFLQPLVSSLDYGAVNALAAPRSFALEPTATDPAAYSKTVVSLRGSAVLRWEYLPGSTAYLVWNGNQSDDDPDSHLALSRRLGSVRKLSPNHVFMAKLTYWWGL